MEFIQEIKIQKIVEEDYQPLKYLGQGSYGQVVMARQNATGKNVAFKLVRKDRTTEKAFFQELCVSIFLSSHEGIISTQATFCESKEYFMMTQELAPAGSLHSLIQRDVGIPEEMVKRCAVQLTRALQYMHSKALVHRDLKPDNVLLMDRECHCIKLSDFGLTQVAGTLVPSMSPIIAYMAPELCNMKPKDSIVLDPSVDVWALGILLYMAYTGSYPWKRAVEDDLLFQEFINWQGANQHTSPPICWQKFSRKAQDLFHILLAKEPTKRNLVDVVLDYLDFPWEAEVVPEPTIEVEIEEEETEVRDYEVHIIVIEAEEEYIIVEDHGDVDYIIVSYSSEESVSISTTSAMIWTDNTNLVLGSEVAIS